VWREGCNPAGQRARELLNKVVEVEGMVKANLICR